MIKYNITPPPTNSRNSLIISDLYTVYTKVYEARL